MHVSLIHPIIEWILVVRTPFPNYNIKTGVLSMFDRKLNWQSNVQRLRTKKTHNQHKKCHFRPISIAISIASKLLFYRTQPSIHWYIQLSVNLIHSISCMCLCMGNALCINPCFRTIETLIRIRNTLCNSWFTIEHWRD